ncbi:ABC transporter ATP-binding protein [Frigidibacter oleivorans]|uniref:ABC transporter ATP-binding protein n=1 Tax=Frigidibacter oleivorans TaxID=2487129 RepID=UPI000F8EF9AB|nr:ATP-binding cassette domain-containing protein [Frigidibacter oleivorans]
MIRLHALCKRHVAGGVCRVVADAITAELPGGRSIALLGRNGAGKSSLLRMIAGTLAPDSGRISSSGSISWPVGFAGAFHGELTGAQNARFVARIYGVDSDRLCADVEAVARLGPHIHQPVRSYSSGLRARLAFGLSMAIRFDTYLVDEVTSVGDAAFRLHSEALLRDRLRGASAIVVSHQIGMLRRLCDMGAVLDRGRLTLFDDLEAAIRHHGRLMQAEAEARVWMGRVGMAGMEAPA